MGDEALMRGAVKRAEESGYGDIRVLYRRGGSKKYGAKLVSRYSPVGVIRAVAETNALVFGGGTLLQDRTSRRSLFYYLSLIGLAKAFGKPWEMWSGGIGELRGERGRVITGKYLRDCRHIGVRDRASYRVAGELVGDPERIFLEDDLSVSTKACQKEWGEYLKRCYGITRKYIIAAPKGGEIDRHYREMMRHIKSETDKGALAVICSLYPGQDREICERMADKCGGIFIEKISPEEFRYLSSGAMCVVGMRLHSLIFASMSGTPYIGIGDDIKIKAYNV
jgi:polysaccharide pyruvyl transferase CsaB